MADYKVVDIEKLEAGLTATANAIREKTGDSEKILWNKQNGMASAIDRVFKEASAAGRAEILGSFDSLYYFFGTGVRRNLYAYLMDADLSHITNTQYMFVSCNWLTEFDFPETLHSRTPHYMFQDCVNLTRVSGISEHVSGSVLSGIFAGCTSLENAGTISFDNVLYTSKTFLNCSSLKEIRIAGEIQVSLSFSDSGLLSDASVQSIIDHLKDLTGAATQTLTFHAEVGAKLTEEQKVTITEKNWTLVY